MKTGTSMQGSIVNTRRVKSVKCECRCCFHAEKLRSKIGGNTWYCKYYDQINPSKTSCARYYKVREIYLPKKKKKTTNKKKK